jgi:hypothetical protein
LSAHTVSATITDVGADLHTGILRGFGGAAIKNKFFQLPMTDGP